MSYKDNYNNKWGNRNNSWSNNRSNNWSGNNTYTGNRSWSNGSNNQWRKDYSNNNWKKNDWKNKSSSWKPKHDWKNQSKSRTEFNKSKKSPYEHKEVKSIPWVPLLDRKDPSNVKLRLDFYSHFFVVTPRTQRQRNIVKEFTRKYIKYVYQWNRWTKQNERVEGAGFFIDVRGGQETHLHINMFDAFRTVLIQNGFDDGDLEVFKSDIPDDFYKKLDIEMYPKWQLRETQEEAKQFLLDEKIPTGLIGLPPGEGKTVTMLAVGNETKSRFLLLVRPQYIERWIDAFLETYVIERDDIIVVQGSKQLRSLFNDALDDAKRFRRSKAIIISNKTFASYLKDYATLNPDEFKQAYPVIPPKYATTLNARYVYIDEGHQDFHLNFRIALNTNVKKMITATGTLVPDDPFLKNMTNIQYPPNTRYQKKALSAYIRGASVVFAFKVPEAIRHITNQGYSHVEFEKSIMRHRPTKDAYYKLIKDCIDHGYMGERKPGYKCVVFVATVKMASELTEYLRKCYPGLDIRRYCEDDPYENLMDPDIRVTTIISGGTAVDVPGLSYGLLTQALSASQANLQVIGRLRIMKDGFNPVFHWLVATNIEKHLDYHFKKRKLFEDVLLTYECINWDRVI